MGALLSIFAAYSQVGHRLVGGVATGRLVPAPTPYVSEAQISPLRAIGLGQAQTPIVVNVYRLIALRIAVTASAIGMCSCSSS